MENKKREFREDLKIEQKPIIQVPQHVPEGYDMQAYPQVVLIDDDPNLVNDLKKQLPSVIFKTIDIETIIRNISRRTQEHSIEHADLIFIDTLYKDEQSDAYAIDFFDMYRSMSSEIMNNTENKYKVVIGIDDMKQRIKSKNQGIEAIRERTEISSLLGKAHKHPYIEWGLRQGSKTETIIKEIENYAEKTKIYLYKSPEMSLEEWIEYIKSLISKINNLISEIQDEKLLYSGKMRLNAIISSYREEIDRVNEILGLSGENKENKIKTIKDALECTKTLFNNTCAQTQNLNKLGIDENNQNLRNISHHFINSILSVQYLVFKTERSMQKEK